MAQLPNAEYAIIPMEKLTDYCLNADHPRGKDKARVFAAVLGLTRNDAKRLATLVQQAARQGEVTKEELSPFGYYYRVDWPVSGKEDVILRTIWEIRPGETIPRLVTAFIK